MENGQWVIKSDLLLTIESAASKVFSNNVLVTLLSEYVEVQDVGKFAGITRATYSVLSTPGFWRKLYQRCTDLPVELHDPAILNHSRGLRATVIRALRIRYSHKFKNVRDATNNELVKDLVETLCVDQDWRCSDCFKFKKTANLFLDDEDDSGANDRDEMRTLKREKKAQLKDLRYNPDEGFRVLRIQSESSHQLTWLPPNVKQQKLVSLFWNRPKQRFEMTFDSGTKIVYTEVYYVKIINWWNFGWWRGTVWKAGHMSDLSIYERAEAEVDEADEADE